MQPRLLLLFTLFASAPPAQETERTLYFPKPAERTAYEAPMRPVTRLADLQARNHGRTNWREKVVDDGDSLAWMIQEAPGSRYERRLYPDSPAWWVVLRGRIRFEIERPAGGFDVFEASRGSYVFAPERLLHSLEVAGSEPAIRFEVTLAKATPVFEKAPSVPPGAGLEYIPVRLSTGPNPLDVPDPDDQPWPNHVNIHELAKANEERRRWSQPAMRKNRVRGNFICGHADTEPPLAPGARGHFHADFAEFWVVMTGELRWIFEGDAANAVTAREGDIVYAPPKTFHIPQFWGKEGLNCRLTSSTYPSANHIFDASP
jgi:mannose-6-phosphate isomerase-like protein (cupin superfamily)